MTFCPNASSDLQQLAKGATLLLPAVSTGNVPQLTVDLLLASLPHTLLGSFHSAHVQPCIGGDALAVAAPSRKKGAAAAVAPAVLTTALQVWSIPSLQLLVLQQRAPALRGRHRAFVSELLEWSRSLQLKQIILLTASLAFRRGDEELDAAHPVSFFLVDPAAASSCNTSSSSSSSSDRVSATLSLLRETLQFNPLQSGGIARGGLEQDEQPFRFDQLNSAEEETADQEDSMRIGGGGGSAQQMQQQRETAGAPLPRIPVPGLGITRPFFEMVTGAAAPASSAVASSSAASLPPTLFLSVFVNEGANDRDAMMLCHHLYTLLFLQKAQQTKQEAQSAAAADKNKPLVEPDDMVWTAPISWRTVFGNEPDESLYL